VIVPVAKPVINFCSIEQKNIISPIDPSIFRPALESKSRDSAALPVSSRDAYGFVVSGTRDRIAIGQVAIKITTAFHVMQGSNKSPKHAGLMLYRYVPTFIFQYLDRNTCRLNHPPIRNLASLQKSRIFIEIFLSRLY
jgi:hypothetical protein